MFYKIKYILAHTDRHTCTYTNMHDMASNHDQQNYAQCRNYRRDNWGRTSVGQNTNI